MIEANSTRPSTTLWRALGIDLFLKGFKGALPFFKAGTVVEKQKTALCDGRLIALTRCAIHVLPVLITLTFLTLNYIEYYIGDELAGISGKDSQKLNALQFAAKLHELLINASISVVLMSYIRYELTLGHGLPFGAMLGGYEFTSLSYIWSKEFWAAITKSKAYYSISRRTAVAILLFTATILASVTNPASAIIMIPRSDFWRACGTQYWLNSSSDALWPARVESASFDASRCSQVDTSKSFDCPAAGIEPIKAFATNLRRRGFDAVPVKNHIVYGGQSSRNMNITMKIGRDGDNLTSAFVPSLAHANAFVEAGTWWPTAARFAFGRSKLRYWLSRQALIKTKAFAPATRVQCSSLVSTDGIQNRNIIFPSMDIRKKTFIQTSYTEPELWSEVAEDLSSDAKHPKLYWRNLSDANFENSTAGAIIVLPLETGSTEITYTACNVDARWAPSRLWTFDGKTVLGLPDGLPDTARPLGYLEDDWPWPHVLVDLAWAENLNQDISRVGETISAFASIAMNAGITADPDETHPYVVEIVLAIMFADALARVQGNAALQGELKGRGTLQSDGWEDGPWVDEFMSFGEAYDVDQSNDEWYSSDLTVYVYGYAFSFNSGTGKFACAILLFHTIIAVLHTTYSFWSKLTSSSWDSVAELTVLAINSSPSKKLRNVCAGISHLTVLGYPVKIMEGYDSNRHLEIAIDEDILDRKTLQINKEYGTLPDDGLRCRSVNSNVGQGFL